MYCNATIIYGRHRRKNASKREIIIGCINDKNREHIFSTEKQQKETLERINKAYEVTRIVGICGGEIESNISLISEPFYGGVDHSIEIEFKCKKCGNMEFPSLPFNLDELNDFLNQKIEEM